MFIHCDGDVLDPLNRDENEAEADASMWRNRLKHADQENIALAVASSVYKYYEETGQTYQAYKDGENSFSKDKMKMDRLDLQHQLFHITLGGKLYASPMNENPLDVLDIATGDENWVLDFASRNPAASIIANDSNPVQLKFAPPNIVFEVADANETWTYGHQFDFIHCRQHHRRIEEHKLFEQSIQFLKPGGWIEMQELCNPVTCDDGTLTEGSPLTKWGRLIVEASARVKKNSNNPASYESWMRQAGFTNVRTEVHKWPTNSWPEDEKEKLKGLWNLYNVLDRLQVFTVALFTKVLGWAREDVDAFLVDVSAELQNRDVHAYWPVYIVYGQKPLPVSSGR
ncbi:hypothetical protein FQN57_003856 [Myotisia sp. PD_48]|nr:hypothetical protein FQN57_003856 [Myotisia sp. PD_48]